MSAVHLEDHEWQQVLAIISTAPWRDANQLLMKIGGQLRLQVQPNTPQQPSAPQTGNGPSKEVSHGE